MSTELNDQKYPKPEQRQIFYDTLIGRLQAIPGIAVGVASPRRFRSVEAKDAGSRSTASQRRRTGNSRASPTSRSAARYFDTVGAAIRRGRALTDADGAPGAEVAVVNERFAAQHLPERGSDRPAHPAVDG